MLEQRAGERSCIRGTAVKGYTMLKWLVVEPCLLGGSFICLCLENTQHVHVRAELGEYKALDSLYDSRPWEVCCCIATPY